MSESSALSVEEQRKIWRQALNSAKLLDYYADQKLASAINIMMILQAVIWTGVIGALLGSGFFDELLDTGGLGMWVLTLSVAGLGLAVVRETATMGYDRNGAERLARSYASTFQVDAGLRQNWVAVKPGVFRCTFDGVNWQMEVENDSKVTFRLPDHIEGMSPKDKVNTDLCELAATMGEHRLKPYRSSIDAVADVVADDSAEPTEPPAVQAEAPSAATES